MALESRWKSFFPSCGTATLCRMPGLGAELALENPDAFFLSQSGECFHNVTVTGGKQRSEGPLSMKRELRDVLSMLGELEHALRDGETRLLTLGHEIKDLTSLLDRLEGEKRDAEKQAMTSGHVLQQLDSEMARVAERLNVCERELQRLSAERAEQETAIQARQSEISAADERRIELERLAASANEQLAVLREQRDAATQRSSEQLARVAMLEERHRSATAVVERIESLVAEMTERVSSLQNQINASEAEKLQREADNQGTRPQARRNGSGTKCRRSPGWTAAVRIGASPRTPCRTRTSCCTTPAACSTQARDRKAELAAAEAKLKSDAQYMAETCLNELGIERDVLVADSTIPVASGEQLAAEDQSYREMRARLEAMGPVNMMALEEYKETSERHAFLETQRKDLLESIENTQATIRRLTFSRGRSSKKLLARSTRTSKPHSKSCLAEAMPSCGSPTRRTARKAALTWWPRLREKSCKMFCCFPAEKKRSQHCLCWSEYSNISPRLSAFSMKWTLHSTKPTLAASRNW